MEVEELPNVHDSEWNFAQHLTPAEAFAAKNMPDLGLEIEDFQAQTWRIENWSQQPRRMQGPEFSCGGHKW